jgi:citrate lyase beta subunit
VVADLEDAVAPADKPAAREVVARLKPPVVRINGADTEWFDDDLALVAELELDALILPKSSPDAAALLGPDGPPVIAIVETAQGLRRAYETASSTRVAALIIGAVDLGAELGLEPRADGLEILHARSRVVVDSAAAGLRPPFDIVHLDIADDTGLEAECEFARSLGFRGKACIHPQQVPIVNRTFVPSQREVAWAQHVVDEFEASGEGVLKVNGEMIDLPVVQRARKILEERSEV